MGVSTSPSLGLEEILAEKRELIAMLERELHGHLLPDFAVSLVGQPTPTEATIKLEFVRGVVPPPLNEAGRVDVRIWAYVLHQFTQRALIVPDPHMNQTIPFEGPNGFDPDGESRTIPLSRPWPTGFSPTSRDDYLWVIAILTPMLEQTRSNDIVIYRGFVV